MPSTERSVSTKTSPLSYEERKVCILYEVVWPECWLWSPVPSTLILSLQFMWPRPSGSTLQCSPFLCQMRKVASSKACGTELMEHSEILGIFPTLCLGRGTFQGYHRGSSLTVQSSLCCVFPKYAWSLL